MATLDKSLVGTLHTSAAQCHFYQKEVCISLVPNPMSLYCINSPKALSNSSPEDTFEALETADSKKKKDPGNIAC